MEPISSVLIPAIVETVFGSLAEAAGLSDWLRQRLGRDPEKLAFQQALTQALTDSATHFPGRDLRYFAEILRDIGGPLLARTLQPAAPLPTADELTNVWLNHLTVDSLIHYRAEFTQFATDFLDRLQFHLENQQPLRWITQARHERSSEEIMRRMADAAEQSLTHVEALHQEVARLTAALVTVLQTGSSSTVTTGGGAYIGSNVSAKHFAGRDLTINQYFVEGLARLVFNYSARIENFLYEYLGGKEKRVPFGGRQAQIDQLNTWLDTPDTPPYLLMVAEAGGGKSALVTRWCAQLATRTDLDVIFVPISIRFQTAAQDVAFAALAARLAQIYEQQSTLPAALSAEQWKGQCETYLRLPLPAGKRLLVVIDGLDEATGWEAGPELFAKRPPTGLRILATARVRATEVDADRWATRLGWQDEQIAHKFHLPGLDRRGIEEALVSMGNPLDHLATQVDLVGELHRLSQGDPLLVRLYVEALQAMGATVARLRPEDLANIEPGLDGFMERWWEDQRKQWRMQGKDPFAEEERLLPLLNACTVACGPLLLNDLAELDKQHFGKGLLVTHMAELLGRWVIGDGRKQGYVFSHPRLRNYFSDRMTPDEEREWQAKFCAWGERVLTALNTGTLDPKQAPEYLLRYYSTHLERSHAPAEAFYALISNGWRLAWEELDVSYGGFLGDVERASAKAKQAFDGIQPGQSVVLVQQVRSALCRSSVASLNGNIPSELLTRLVLAGLRTPVQALEILKLVKSEHLQAQMIVALMPHLPNQLQDKALALAYEIHHCSTRSFVFREIVPYLPKYEQKKALAEALSAARAIKDDHHRAPMLVALASHFSENERVEIFEETLVTIHAIEHGGTRANILTSLAAHLPVTLIEMAFSAAISIKYEPDRANALIALAPHMPVELIGEALNTIRAIKYRDDRARALSAFAAHLSVDLMKEAVLGAQFIVGLHSEVCADILIPLAPYLPLELLKDAWTIAHEISSNVKRVHTLDALALYFPESERIYVQKKTQKRALTGSPGILTDDDYISALSARVPHLSPELLRTELDRIQTKRRLSTSILVILAPYLPDELKELALSIIGTIPETSDHRFKHHPDRARALLALAPYLSVELMEKAIYLAYTIQDRHRRDGVLIALVPYLSSGLLEEISTLLYTIGDELNRVRTLGSLIQNLPSHLLEDVLSKELNSIHTIYAEKHRVATLNEIIPHLPINHLHEVLLTITSIGGEDDRACLLEKLAPRLPTHLLEDAFSIIHSIKNKQARHSTLKAIAPRLSTGLLEKALSISTLDVLARYLPIELLSKALTIVHSIEDEDDRFSELIELAPYVPSDLLEEALAIACDFRHESYYYRVLISLAPCLPSALLVEALAYTKLIEGESHRANALNQLVPHLSDGELEDVLDIIQTIKEGQHRGRALVGLAPRLPNKLIWQALNIALPIEDKWSRANTLIELALHLPKGEQNEVLKIALTTIRAISDDSRSLALGAFAVELNLPESERIAILNEALAFARTIRTDESRIHALSALTPHLSEYERGDVLAEVLTTVCSLESRWRISDRLRVITPRLVNWANQQPAKAHNALTDTLSTLATHPRPEFFDNLTALMPFILALAGDEAPQAAAGIYHAIQEVCAWWP